MNEEDDELYDLYNFPTRLKWEDNVYVMGTMTAYSVQYMKWEGSFKGDFIYIDREGAMKYSIKVKGQKYRKLINMGYFAKDHLLIKEKCEDGMRRFIRYDLID